MFIDVGSKMFQKECRLVREKIVKDSQRLASRSVMTDFTYEISPEYHLP